MDHLVRMSVRVEGIVQGVGYRPFVHALATGLGLAGHVGNDAAGVFLEVEGAPAAVTEFVTALRDAAPPLAVVDAVRATHAPPRGTSGFRIVASAPGTVHTLIAADSAPCGACLAELADPADRRYRYPFINCTHCGPRYTIVRGVPYDRPLTTMAAFAMCQDCAREYHDPADRRFHAQPVCCPACGPTLRLDGHPGDPITVARQLLADGKVVAVKGIGGYHLAADAAHPTAAATLRARKHREEKPFAVMVPDLVAAAELCTLDDTAADLLTSRRRPIVLLPRRSGAPVSPAVAPGNRRLGLMLPYSPLHHLLVTRPLVLTSGNVSDEPIAFDDDDARTRLGPLADAMLSHDRPIHIRADDSVVRPFRGREQVQRRSRGYAPEPISLHTPVRRAVLGCGAELKNTFCLAKNRHAFVSQHIGDLENAETLRAFTDGIAHLARLFDIHPTVIAHDLHPEYLSTKYALEQDAELVGVQHHHAHIAACLADNGDPGPVLGVAFDGLGYGTDGTLWGGEFLRADLDGFTRLAHLATVPMPGGAAAIREPWRMAAAYGVPDTTEVARRNGSRWSAVCTMAARGVHAPATSSAGRLFDAVAAVLGVRDTVSYEGQAAIELEQLADPAVTDGYRLAITDGDPVTLTGADLVHAALDDRRRGTPPSTVAARFHNGVTDAITRTCRLLRGRTGLTTVAMSGGVFQNLLLLDRTVDALADNGFRVLIHHRVPTNDGGISLGQVAVAGR